MSVWKREWKIHYSNQTVKHYSFCLNQLLFLPELLQNSQWDTCTLYLRLKELSLPYNRVNLQNLLLSIHYILLELFGAALEILD